jgi:hypothetical protein
MTWFTDSQIAAEAMVGKPVKARTINRIQQNISAAFSGDSGAPPLSSNVAGFALAGMALDAVGSHRQMTYLVTSNSALFIAGVTYSAMAINTNTNSPQTISAGTWICLGGGITAMLSATSVYFTYLFRRVV